MVEKEKHEARGDLEFGFNAPSLVDGGWVIRWSARRENNQLSMRLHKHKRA